MGLIQEGDFTIAWKGDKAIVRHLPTGIEVQAVGNVKEQNLAGAMDAMEKMVACALREKDRWCSCSTEKRCVHLASYMCLACGKPVDMETYKQVIADYRKQKR